MKKLLTLAALLCASLTTVPAKVQPVNDIPCCSPCPGGGGTPLMGGG